VRLALWFVLTYLLGSVPTSFWVARAFGGMDLRTFGSGNLGATNLYRAMGWKAAVPVALFDVAKGAIPVAVFASRAGEAAWLPVALGIAAVVGHVYSVFVRFKGGKGVATAAGVVIVLAPLAFLACAALWALVLRLSGYMSLASLTAATAFPVATALLGPDDPYTLALAIVLAAVIIFTHRANIRRLLDGTEARLGKERPAT
jgi:glycerol-3-phosphate acyltransferase PlsY